MVCSERVNVCCTGPLPPAWSFALQRFTAVSNSLTGSLPDSWHQLPALDVVRLANNMLNGANLRFVYVGADVLTCAEDSNKCHDGCAGSLPESWSQLPLQYMDVGNNSLEGSLPPSWASPTSKLTFLNLSTNSITGNAFLLFMVCAVRRWSASPTC